MIKRDGYKLSNWSGGDEGRLWEWRPGTGWRVFEPYNYRRTFEEVTATPRDSTALRQHFDISDGIPDSEPLQFSPAELTRITQKIKGGSGELALRHT